MSSPIQSFICSIARSRAQLNYIPIPTRSNHRRLSQFAACIKHNPKAQRGNNNNSCRSSAQSFHFGFRFFIKLQKQIYTNWRRVLAECLAHGICSPMLRLLLSVPLETRKVPKKFLSSDLISSHSLPFMYK